ncbi:MAG TPA: hypothetical protein VJ805_13730 [Nitrospiraceae bacterium]|nr:hypothetical protein [Nitrospiraceae bacterium]
MRSVNVAARERVVIVDRNMDFGLKLADCLASSGYHAVLGRSLDAILDDLDELKPGAILLSSDLWDRERSDDGADTLRTVKALCPEVPVLSLMRPGRTGCTDFPLQERTWMTGTASLQTNRVEQLLQGKLGVCCARML